MEVKSYIVMSLSKRLKYFPPIVVNSGKVKGVQEHVANLLTV